MSEERRDFRDETRDQRETREFSAGKKPAARFDGEVQITLEGKGEKEDREKRRRSRRKEAVGQSWRKIDSDALTQGRGVYTGDLVEDGALFVKILRSPHPHAKILRINKEEALALPGVVAVFTYEDVPQKRFTLAGQSFPEPSHYDRLVLDRVVRYVGDEVAVVAAEDRRAAEAALEKIHVEYEVLPAVLDFEKATEADIAVHAPDEVVYNLPPSVGGQDLARNVVGVHEHVFGEDDWEQVWAEAELRLDETYYTQAQAQSMMETFRSYSRLDARGRLEVISSTQVPFHIKRQLARAFELPPGRIRVIKPRVGGGFGAKQTSVSEIFCALVTLKTSRPAYIEYSREECFTASNSRHAMRVRVQMAARRDGTVEGINIEARSDQGAYSMHAWTTLGLVGEKTLPLFAHLRAARFFGEVVYTNKMPAGAFRGYGATQGCFAVESALNEMARRLDTDPAELRLKNICAQGQRTTAYGKLILSTGLDRCIRRGKELLGVEDLRSLKYMDEDHVRSYGMAMSMQGSGIAHVDVSTAAVKLGESGDYTLLMSPTDVGTGTDTVLTQMAAEILQTNPENMAVITADTDITPYDPGSYASSGVYVTGGAVVRACEDLRRQILHEAARIYGLNPRDLDLIADQIESADGEFKLALCELAEQLSSGPEGKSLQGFGSFGSDTSPPPFMAGFVEIETDLATGKVRPIRMIGVADCGKVINPSLARVQMEGGLVQGLGLALYEQVDYGSKGQILTNDFLTYRIPNRRDIGEVICEFAETYEPSGPFGAKSIGEIVINTPAPAVFDAIQNVTGKALRRLPIRSEDVFFALQEKGGERRS